MEGSLRHLDVEFIDLYCQHRVDPNVPIEETVGALGELVNAGKVRFKRMRRQGELQENVAALDAELSAEQLAEIDAVFPLGSAAGTRYPEAMMKALGR